MEKLYTLSTDACHYVYSEVLTHAVESPDDLRPIAYTSGSFSDIQQRWSATEKDFAVYQSVLKFYFVYEGQNVHYSVITDC